MNIFLFVDFAEQLGEDFTVSAFLESLFSSVFFYAAIIFILFLLIFLFFFLIKPAVSEENPERLYKKYLKLKEDMSKIDDLFLMREISYQDYVYAQFNNANEYEKTIIALSQHPEYKGRLKTDSIMHSRERDQEEKNLYKTGYLLKRKIDLLCEILAPQAKYYTKDELRQGVLDQGYGINIADGVVEKLADDGASFGSEGKQRKKKTNKLFSKLVGDNKLPKKNNNINKKVDSSINKNKPTKKSSAPVAQGFVKNFNNNEEKVPISNIKFNNKDNVADKKVHISKFKFIDNKQNEDGRFFSTVFKKKKKIDK